MNKLFIAILISLSTLLFACSDESSSNGDGGGGGGFTGDTSGGSVESPGEAIDARNQEIQEGLNAGSEPDPLTSTEPEPEPVEIEPLDNEDEDSLNDSDS